MAPLKTDAEITLAYTSPEIIITLPKDLPNDLRELEGESFHFKSGGLGIAATSKFNALRNAPDINAHLFVPNYEIQLSQDTRLERKQLKQLQTALRLEGIHLINDSAFREVRTEGGKSLIYKNTPTTTNEHRAVSFADRVHQYLQIAESFGKPFDVVWGNDWKTALILSNAKALGLSTIFTLHGVHTNDVPEVMISRRMSTPYDELRPFMYNKHGEEVVDLLATGIHAADYITTVSNGFLEALHARRQNIPASDYVFNLIASKIESGNAQGIINPLSREESQFLTAVNSQSIGAVEAQRQQSRAQLSEVVGLTYKREVPLLVFPNRLDNGQKNPALFLDMVDKITQDADTQFLILGDKADGQEHYLDWAQQLTRTRPGQVAYSTFKQPIEDLVLQSANTYGVMTSDYEPCGTPNVLYPFEGIPVLVHAIDGLKDTTPELNWEQNTGRGFPYYTQSHDAFRGAHTHLVAFNNLPLEAKYAQLTRIATEAQSVYAGKNKEALCEIVRQTHKKDMY